MKPLFGLAAAAVALTLATSAVAEDASESEMMSHCNTYAAKHLNLSTSDIASVKYEGQRTHGTHAVNGETTTGITFQCSFGPHGKQVVSWTHTAPSGCPADISEASRYLYPDCN